MRSGASLLYALRVGSMLPHAHSAPTALIANPQAQLLRRLQRDADEKAVAADAAPADGGDGASGSGAAAGGDAQLAGMKQEELVQWYLMEQINRWAPGGLKGGRWGWVLGLLKEGRGGSGCRGCKRRVCIPSPNTWHAFWCPATPQERHQDH